MAPRVGAALATLFSRFERLTILKTPGFAGGWLFLGLLLALTVEVLASRLDHSVHSMAAFLKFGGLVAAPIRDRA